METESSVLEALIEAQGLYITGLYSLAKQKFTTILSAHPNNYDALVYRAYTNLKLNSLEDAAKDAGTALIVDSNRSEALLVKGIILFHQGKFDAAASEIHRAKLILSSLDASDPRRAEADKWEQKIDVERVKRAPGQKAEEQKGERTGNVSQHHPQAGKVSYKWYQNDNKITVEINFGLKKKEDLNVKIENRRVEISFPINESKSFELSLDLFDEIDSGKSQANVHIDRVEIQLEKVNKGRNWTFLERPDSQNEKVLETVTPKPVQETSTQQSGPFYPSSSKVKRDWSKIDKEIEEDMRKHKDEYAGEDPLNEMFKQIYKNADENTRKAMIKSFQTSGGTVLSTNWDEVKEKDYQGKDRPSAPDGQEYRQWGK